ncbi:MULTISPECIES: DUF1569 domain-containing protein [Flavobacterium]|uniref:DUF1569 domain-containing protein n=1 Tax=Flavobacterium TaxID=237 RepID=UPI0004DF2AA3|nr:MULTISPECIES: DUF1569 domain-containing protein [Flavobacterium]
MKSIFDNTTRVELINRIMTLNDSSIRQWGKMNIHQMIKHCILCEEMYLGKTKYKRSFIGFLFGKIALNILIKNENPKKKNSPTKVDFKNFELLGNIETEKLKWIKLVQEYETYTEKEFIHWFYGKMTKYQIGISVYKHIDHHLRQFNS